MRVLQIHNYYRSSAPSGEDTVVRNERALLQARGIEVEAFERYNDTLGDGLAAGVRAALSNIWSHDSYRALRTVIRRVRPDVAHVHNTFPQISPSAYEACRDEHVPVIQTLHNYRLLCANGLLLRAGKPCERCVGRWRWPAVAHACYRDSHAASASLALAGTVHALRGTYASGVDRYIALTRFARDRLIAGGLPSARIIVRGNALPSDPGAGDGAGGYVLFVGRLTDEKGVRTLVRAWQRLPDVPLRIAGDGALRVGLMEQARGLPIEFLGARSREDVFGLMRGAALLVIPSEWYEGFPLVVLEAMAMGTPIVAADIGSLAELVTDPMGGRFAPGDAPGLAAMVRRLWTDPPALARMRLHNRARYLEKYGTDRTMDSLARLYAEVCELRQSGARWRPVI